MYSDTSNNLVFLIDVVLPVYNEEKVLSESVHTLTKFLSENCPYDWRIVIADNASTDSTPDIAQSLAAQSSKVTYLRIPLKGRGRALREAWLRSNADILSYMDVDLSTDLSCFIPMIEAIATGRADIVSGSRYKKGAVVKRGVKREILSRGYIGLLKLFFHCHFTDSQCGFKAVSRKAVQALVPLIENQGWFFDAELLLLAEHFGFPLFEVPVLWTDDPDSRVKIAQTVSEHFMGLLRMRLAFSTGLTQEPLDPMVVHASA
ncbi:MAG: dolichyl-phosphate beta-glucosyltransferase [bacterium]